MARPKKPKESRKTRMIFARVTEGEYTKLKAVAEDWQVSLTALVRSALKQLIGGVK